MALTASYNTAISAYFSEIFTATSWWTVFSANKTTLTAFDLFPDTVVANDCIYFGTLSTAAISDLFFNIWTPIVATWLVLKREYYRRWIWWTDIEDLKDDTVWFTVAWVNRVRFPVQREISLITINSLSRIWVRCRVVSVTAMSEWWANQIARVWYAYGVMNFSWTTDLVPWTFTEIYNYIKANYPYISISVRNWNSFNFTKIWLNLYSRIKTTNEIIEIWQNCTNNAGVANNNLHFLESWIKSWDRWYAGSTFIVYWVSNSWVVDLSENAKVYGTVFKTWKYAADLNVYSWYMRTKGELIDNVFEISTFVPATTDIWLKNIKIVWALLISSTTIWPYENVFYICTWWTLFYVYTEWWTLKSFWYKFTTTGAAYLIYVYLWSWRFNQVWKLIDPSVPLTSMLDTIKPVAIAINADTFLDSVKYYNSTTLTYTDLTAVASSTTVNDVPLWWNVWDSYYFGGLVVSNVAWFSLKITKTTDINDYVYVWEYYAWTSRLPVWTYFWDSSANMSKTWEVFLWVDVFAMSSLIIDWFNAKWIRARIVSKWVWTPIASRIVRKNVWWASNWSVQEKYSLNIRIVDKLWTAISWVTIVWKNQNWIQIFSTTTDINWYITEQELLKKEFHFDPQNFPTTYISENPYTTFDIEMSKTWYENYTQKWILINKHNLTITLNPVVNIRDADWNKFIALTPALWSSSRMTKL